VIPAVPAPPAPTIGASLFARSSLWNTRKTTTLFAAAADSTLHGTTYGINDGAYSHPTFFAKSSDPVTTFHLGAGWGFPATTIASPAPAGMHQAPGGDAVMTVLLTDGRLLDMYGVSGSGTNWTAAYYGISDGINGPGFGSGGHAIGTTAIGSPQGAGTILARDVAAGVISHALCIAFSDAALGGVGTGGPQVAPAVNSDDNNGTGPLPEGGLLLIPAGTPKPAGLTRMGSALWDAASTYGVYITDQLGGPPMFYGDGSVSSAFSGNDFSAVGKALRLAQTW
jgi:hypothetical protein